MYGVHILGLVHACILLPRQGVAPEQLNTTWAEGGVPASVLGKLMRNLVSGVVTPVFCNRKLVCSTTNSSHKLGFCISVAKSDMPLP